MKHREARKLMTAKAPKEMTSAELAAVCEHIASCKECTYRMRMLAIPDGTPVDHEDLEAFRKAALDPEARGVVENSLKVMGPML